MNSRARTAGFALLAAVAFGVAGCSGSGSVDQSSTATASASSSSTTSPAGRTTLPAGWPSDVPAPAGLTLLRVIPSPASPTGKIAVYSGEAKEAAVEAKMTAGLAKAGYTKVSSSAPGSTVAVSQWKKGETSVGVNISSAAGNVTCSVTVSPVD